MFGDNLERIVAAIEKNYEADEIFFTKPGRRFPSRTAIKGLITELRRVLFPGYFGEEMLSPYTTPTYFIGDMLMNIERVLRQQVVLALKYTDEQGRCTADIEIQAADICTRFFDQLPDIQRTLLTDVQALFDGDPAAESKEEVIFAYPGLYAIYVYRIAHVLHQLQVPLLPRTMTELAHSGTGIDIGAGADIGEYFFIDHGTGVVIGETCTIGSYVKLYQGVTLGAKSFPEDEDGNPIKGGKRHPDIGSHVVIYANATVLGGNTVIGDGCVIGGNAWLTHSVTAEEQALIQQKMALLHTANFSAYARKMLIDGYIVNVDTSDIRAQTAEIQKIGVNVNQIARRVNSTGTVYAQDMEDIKGALAEIWQLQRYILSSQR